MFLATAASVAVLGVAAGFAFAGHATPPASRSDCVDASGAGVMGGGTWHVCGARVTDFCAAHGKENTELAAACANAVKGRTGEHPRHPADGG